ncbi:MAG TPA: hypothetical protein DIU00_00105 [Phycisphaerales bacterium]|nr:hypothetical protein [Phycisphaerales bacterium]
MVNPAGIIGCTSLPSYITYLCVLVALWLIVYLKKQSQFTPALMGVTLYMKGDYGVKPAAGAEENKAKQSRSDTEWIPAFAGMTNMGSLHGGKI